MIVKNSGRTAKKTYLASEHCCQGIRCSFCRAVHRGWDQNFRGDGANVDDATTLRHATYANNSLRPVNQPEDVGSELVLGLLFLNLHDR